MGRCHSGTAHFIASRAAERSAAVHGTEAEDSNQAVPRDGDHGAFVGLFAPPFLLASAIGAGIGAITGKLAKSHEEKKFGTELDQYMDADSSAILVVMDNQYLDGVEAALGKANERVNKAISKGDYDDIVDALNKGSDEIADAVDS